MKHDAEELARKIEYKAQQIDRSKSSKRTQEEARKKEKNEEDKRKREKIIKSLRTGSSKQCSNFEVEKLRYAAIPPNASRSKYHEERQSKKLRQSQVNSASKEDLSVADPNGHKNHIKKGKGLKPLPKNVSEYRHLMNLNYIGEADVKWVLDLRKNRKVDIAELKLKNGEPPNFYNDDLSKHKSRIQKSNNELMSQTQNFFNKFSLNDSAYYKERNNNSDIDHLLRRRPDSVYDSNIINYEVSLRDYRISKKSDINSSKWMDVGYKTSSSFLFSDKYPVISKEAHEIFRKTNSFQMKPVRKELKKDKYNDKDIIKRRITFEKDSTGAFLGEHFSLSSALLTSDPLSVKYKGSNLQNIRHILEDKGKLQSSMLWELNLRNALTDREEILKKINDPRERKKNSSISKEAAIVSSDKAQWSGNFIKYPAKSKEKLKLNYKSCCGKR